MGLFARVIAFLAVGMLALSACSSNDPVVVTVTQTGSGSSASSEPPTVTVPSTESSEPTTSETTEETSSAAPSVRISANPAFGTEDLGPNKPITVTAFNATIDYIELTGDDGTTVQGEVSDDGHTWTRTDRLKYGVTYTASGIARATDGTEQPIEGTFTTVNPEKTMAAYVQIPNGHTVGVAAPIIVTFARSVQDRAAAERQLHVSTTDADGNPIEVEGSWGWMPDEDIQGDGNKQSRVHFRPKEYWPAHAQVHLEAELYGVNYGGGEWGREDVVRDFEIGPNLVVKADVESFHLLVVKDDEIIKNYPVSYGIPATEDPGRTTVEGIHIVQDFSGDPETGEFEMCNKKYNYCNSKQYWGVRINNNGEFIHVNKQTEAAGILGKANVSHGCINMGMKDGKEFYDMMYYGVPVEVENTGVPMTERDYVWDWAWSYDRWKTLSAL